MKKQLLDAVRSFLTPVDDELASAVVIFAEAVAIGANAKKPDDKSCADLRREIRMLEAAIVAFQKLIAKVESSWPQDRVEGLKRGLQGARDRLDNLQRQYASQCGNS